MQPTSRFCSSQTKTSRPQAVQVAVRADVRSRRFMPPSWRSPTVNAQFREEACGVPLVFHRVPPAEQLCETTGQTFRSGSKTVTDEQITGTTPKRLEQLFLQLSIHTLARGYEIRDRRPAKRQSDQFRLTFKWLTYILVGILVDHGFAPFLAYSGS